MMASPKATSSMCGDPNQVRYQKALKQITKLINYNNELKEELATAQEELGTVNEKFAFKDTKINQLIQEKEQLEADLNEMTKKYLDAEEENVKLAIEIEELKKKSTLAVQNIPNIGITQSRNMDLQIKRRPFSKDSSGFQQRKIEDLERALAEKNETMKELYSSNNQLRNKLQEIVSQGSQSNRMHNPTLKNHSENLPNFLNNFAKNLETAELQKKLQGSEEWNQKLMIECAQLKSKLLKFENTNNALMRVRSQKYMHQPETPRSAYMTNYTSHRDDTQIIKRAKKLEKQNRKLQKKYEENRLEFDLRREQLKKMREENKILMAKTEGYEKIIEKQEKEMEQMLKSNERELEYYREEFREKLEEQRKSFSPSKNAKTMKLVEVLQAQNRALKKKFSVELTKYIKTLEVYKLKLNENEKELNQMVKEKEKLLEEIAKTKGSRRQRSSHSKNSMIRQQVMQQNFGNSSVIEDL